MTFRPPPRRQRYKQVKQIIFMNWKEFLKPDLRKIIISAIIFIFFPLPVYFQSAGCFTGGLGCKQYWTIMYYGLRLFESIQQGPIFSLGDIVFLLAIIALSYILSCILISAYDKIKSQK